MISVIIPVYNEVENVELLHAKLAAVLDENDFTHTHELIFVDDGSTDGTHAALLKIKAKDPHVVVARLRKNYGQTAAMQAGLDVAVGSQLITMDGDLQNDPADIPRMLAELDRGFDLVCGWRKHRKDSYVMRTFPSRVANWLLSKITGAHVHDSGCSLKAYTRELASRLRLYGDMHRFIPAVSRMAGARVTELAVEHHPRRYGKSKYGIGKTFGVMLDLLTMRVLTAYASNPITGFVTSAMPFVFAGSTLGAIAVFSVFNGNLLDPLFVSLLACSFLCLSAGPYLLFLGLVSEIIVSGKGRIENIVMSKEGAV